MDYFFLISAVVFLALGSIGIYGELFLLLGMVNAICALGYKIFQTGSLLIPKTFSLYSLFLFVLLIHTLVTDGNITFLWIFLSGGLVWLEVFNYKEIFSKYFTPILIILGILMGGFYFYSLSFPMGPSSLASLFSASTEIIKHSDIGDLWAVVLVGVFYLFSKKRQLLYLPLFLIGTYFLAISFSRSALLALAVGIFYIFEMSKSRKKLKNILIISLLCITGLFIYAGMSKTVLFSRPYFWQAITGFVRYPLGTGLGNFSVLNAGTNLVHDIFLEVFSGMGIFSVFFIYWLYRVLRNLFSARNISVEASAVFLAILVDFSFITTYTIPAFIWLWFISLGLMQKEI
jgi:hypothetical protein